MSSVNPGWRTDFLGKQPNNQSRVVIGFATRDSGGYGAFRQLKGQLNERFAVVGYIPIDQDDPHQAEMANGIASMITGMLNRYTSQTPSTEEKNAALISQIGDKLISKSPWLRDSFGFPDGLTLVDKCVDEATNIIYLRESGSSQQASQKLANYLSSGFSWMPDLVTALGDYAAHRNKYPTINDFYPQIVKVLEKSMDKEQKRIDKALK